jgi:hypothetical protein
MTGQYHWVSELAPPSIQKELSYGVGWLTAMGWQGKCPSRKEISIADMAQSTWLEYATWLEV